jgi:hypothetical protein
MFLHYLVSFNTVPCAPGILGFREDSEQQRAGVRQVGGQCLPAVNHLGLFGDVLVINDSCLWTNGSLRNKNAGLDHIEQQMLENHKHWLWIR